MTEEEDIKWSYEIYLIGGSHNGTYVQVSQAIVNSGVLYMCKNTDHADDPRPDPLLSGKQAPPKVFENEMYKIGGTYPGNLTGYAEVLE